MTWSLTKDGLFFTLPSKDFEDKRKFKIYFHHYFTKNILTSTTLSKKGKRCTYLNKQQLFKFIKISLHCCYPQSTMNWWKKEKQKKQRKSCTLSSQAVCVWGGGNVGYPSSRKKVFVALQIFRLQKKKKKNRIITLIEAQATRESRDRN